ncbi:MAG: hypothetical protein ABSA11_09860 [Candidatus Bathyarchaeia archaeon]
MSEKLRESVINWEKEADRLAKEAMKAGAAASEDLEKQLSKSRSEGDKLMKSIGDESRQADKQLRKILEDLESRSKIAQDKLTRAWNELKK